MKKMFPIALVGAAMLTLAAIPESRAQDPVEDSSLEKRVSALETQLADERRKNEETRKLLDQTLVYLDDQAKNGAKVLGVLDASEQAGFTAGINFRSREMLLAGFRNYWGGKEAGLPKPPPAKPAPATNTR